MPEQIFEIVIGDRVKVDNTVFVVVRRSFRRVMYDWYWYLFVRPRMIRGGVIKVDGVDLSAGLQGPTPSLDEFAKGPEKKLDGHWGF